MSPTAFDTLINRLLTPHDTQREAALHSRRGGHRQTAKGPGRRPTLTLADRVVLTLIHDRLRLPSKLFDISQTTASKVIRDTHQLLNQVDHTIDPAEPLTTLAEFTTYITTTGITPNPQNETP